MSDKAADRTFHLNPELFDDVVAGIKLLEVRVGYDNVRSIRPRQTVRIKRGRKDISPIRTIWIGRIRTYTSFEEMLRHESPKLIMPRDPEKVPEKLREVYPREKEERFGVYVFELRLQPP